MKYTHIIILTISILLLSAVLVNCDFLTSAESTTSSDGGTGDGGDSGGPSGPSIDVILTLRNEYGGEEDVSLTLPPSSSTITYKYRPYRFYGQDVTDTDTSVADIDAKIKKPNTLNPNAFKVKSAPTGITASLSNFSYDATDGSGSFIVSLTGDTTADYTINLERQDLEVYVDAVDSLYVGQREVVVKATTNGVNVRAYFYISKSKTPESYANVLTYAANGATALPLLYGFIERNHGTPYKYAYLTFLAKEYQVAVDAGSLSHKTITVNSDNPYGDWPDYFLDPDTTYYLHWVYKDWLNGGREVTRVREIKTQSATSDTTLSRLSGGTYFNYGTFQDLRANMPMIPRWSGSSGRGDVAYNALYQTWAGVRGGRAAGAGNVCNADSDGNLLYAMGDNVMLSVFVTDVNIIGSTTYMFKKDKTEFMSRKVTLGTPNIASIYPGDALMHFMFRPVSGKTYTEVRVIMKGDAKRISRAQGTWTADLGSTGNTLDNYYNKSSQQNYMYWHGYPDTDPAAQQTPC